MNRAEETEAAYGAWGRQGFSRCSLARGLSLYRFTSQDLVRDQVQPDPLGMGCIRSFELMGKGLEKGHLRTTNVSGGSNSLPKHIQITAQNRQGPAELGILPSWGRPGEQRGCWPVTGKS